MKRQSSCNFESSVVKSLKSAFTSAEISAHLRDCAACQETAKVVRFFQSNLSKETLPKNLPVAGLVWWKSRLREKRRAAERVAQPLLIVQVVAAVIFVGLLVWLLNTDSFLNSALNRVFASIEQLIVPLFAGIVCFLFVSLTLIFTLRRFLLEK